MEDLFGTQDPPARSGGSLADAQSSHAPLAVRLRPRNLDEIVGQEHLLQQGSPLYRLAEGQPMSVFLWGPPGVGKTTIASIISRASNRNFVEISAVTAGVKEVRQVINQARADLAKGLQTVLFIDEVHRFSKAQQDVLLPAVENRLVTLVAATTENPSFSVISPLLSRSLLLQLQPLSSENLAVLINRALSDERGLRTPDGGQFTISEAAVEMLLRLAGNDARRVLTYLEESAAATSSRGETEIDVAAVESSADKAMVRYDKTGDQHYDVISAFIKSVRGSDVDAALHYLARMLEAGEDPRFIARRLIILASEDIGMANSNVLSIAVHAAQAVQLIGMPEARLTLAHATIAAATAAKSNAVIKAIDSAIADVRAGKAGAVPPHLRDAHYASAKSYGHGEGYQYPHNYPDALIPQQYLPDELVDATYYEPTNYGHEEQLGERLRAIKARIKPPPGK